MDFRTIVVKITEVLHMSSSCKEIKLDHKVTITIRHNFLRDDNIITFYRKPILPQNKILFLNG